VLRHFAGDAVPAPPATPFSPSLTYELYYGLKEKPFSLSSDPRFLFQSPTHAPAFEALLNGIRRREGLIVLSGEIGTGKTTLIRSVLQNLDRRTFSAFVPDPFVSREDLLKVLLVDFGVVSLADLKRGTLNGASRPDLSYPLYEFLDSLVPLQAFAVMIVDEAQNLPLPLLEEIRILSDLEGREKLLQVVLVGQPELRANLKLPQMRQVDQRVSVRCELSPLALGDVAGYVRHRLNVAGDGDCRVEFSEAAIEAVHRRSGGTPRLINLICDRALHRGHAARVDRIEPEFVQQAIRDLGLDLDEGSTTVSHASSATSVPPPSTESQTDSSASLGSDVDQAFDQTESWLDEATPAASAAPVRTLDQIIAERSSQPVAEEFDQPADLPSQPVLSDFASEHELPRAAVKVVLPPPRTWNRTLVATAAIVLFGLVGGASLYVYAEAQAADTVIVLPASPRRPSLPTLATPAVPRDLLPPVAH
jgi:type II secretory pathway predicted ATPase ExeA